MKDLVLRVIREHTKAGDAAWFSVEEIQEWSQVFLAANGQEAATRSAVRDAANALVESGELEKAKDVRFNRNMNIYRLVTAY